MVFATFVPRASFIAGSVFTIEFCFALKNSFCRCDKDIMNQTAPIVEWTKNGQCNAAFNQLKNALGKVRKEESYMETRTYKPKTDKVVW